LFNEKSDIQNIVQIENNLQQLVKTFNKESFIYDLLLAYRQPKATIKRLKDGGLNLSKITVKFPGKRHFFTKKLTAKIYTNSLLTLPKTGKPLNTTLVLLWLRITKPY